MYRSISLDSYDFTTMAEDCLGKIYFKVNYNPESETLNVNLHKFKYCPDQLTKNGVIVKLKLVPDDRRCLQSPTLTGTGTILVDHDFLFTVPFAELSSRVISGVLQTFRAGRRKTVAWFTRNILPEEVIIK